MPTILCIDDVAVSLSIRKVLLEVIGYSVLTATSGPEGLALLAGNHVDAVILDYRMEPMDGFEVAERIREQYGKIPILLLSGVPRELLPQGLLDIVDARVAKGTSVKFFLSELSRITNVVPAKPVRRVSSSKHLARG